MGKMLLVFRHELTNTVRTAWFVVLTLALPVVALVGIGVYSLVSSSATPPPAAAVTIGYVDQMGGFGGYTQQGKVTFRQYATTADATAALTRGEVAEYVVIPPSYVATGIVGFFTLQRQVSVPDETSIAIRDFLVDNLLMGKVPQSTVDRARNPVTMVPTTLTESGAVASDQGGTGALIVPIALAILLVFSLSFSSSAVLSAVGEEKENRLMEILVSSVSARHLLAGKVLALSVAGLIQIAVWLISAPLVVSVSSSVIGGFFTSLQAPPGLLVLSGAYFVLSYVFFAALMACVGAISPTARDGQQLAGGIMLLMIFPVWFMSLLILNPNHVVTVALTIFPLTTGVVSVIRLGVTDVPAWQIAISLVLLLGSIVGGLLLAAKLFDVYLLSYGRRPPLREMLRSLKG